MVHCAEHDLDIPNEDVCPWCLAEYTANEGSDGCYVCGSPRHASSDCREP